MQIHDLAPGQGARKNRKKVGRGPGSGMGKTSTRGHKGLKARSGGSVRPGFEGGQMPLYRRLPKRGFTNIFKTNNAVLNVKDLDERFDDGAVVDMDALRAIGMVKGRVDGVKILGEGEISKKLLLKNVLVSKTAKEKIEAAGGSIVKEEAPAKAAETAAPESAPAVEAAEAPVEEETAEQAAEPVETPAETAQEAAEPQETQEAADAPEETASAEEAEDTEQAEEADETEDKAE